MRISLGSRWASSERRSLPRGEERNPKLSRGDVAEGEGESRRRGKDARQVVVALRLEVLRVENHPRGEHPHHLSLDETLRFLRFPDLLADGHLLSARQQLRYVGLGAVEGNAAERHGVFLGAVPRREGYSQYLRRGFRVVVEHLVEVSQPEKQYGVGMVLLYPEILAHERRTGSCGELYRICPAR